jgi:hypothetical protein
MVDLRKQSWYKDYYRDFEGLANAKRMLKLCKPEGQPQGRWVWDAICLDSDPTDLKATVRSIGLNLLYEMADGSEIEDLREEDTATIFYAVRELLTCPKWTDVTDADLEKIMNSPDDEE